MEANRHRPIDDDRKARIRRRPARRAIGVVTFLLTASIVAGCAAASGGSTALPGASSSQPASESPASGAGDREQPLLAYAQCMRENGVPNFPDPQPGAGGIDLNGNEFDVDSPAFKAADQACESVLPAPPADGSEDDQDGRDQMLAYARCMRDNGVANFPDPQAGGGIDLNGDLLDIDSPAFKAAEKACASLPGAPSGGRQESQP